MTTFAFGSVTPLTTMWFVPTLRPSVNDGSSSNGGGVVSGGGVGARSASVVGDVSTAAVVGGSAARTSSRAGPTAVGQEGDGEHHEDPDCERSEDQLSRVRLR